MTQDEYRIDAYFREDDGRWVLREALGRDTICPLTIANCHLPLADVYEWIAL